MVLPLAAPFVTLSLTAATPLTQSCCSVVVDSRVVVAVRVETFGLSGVVVDDVIVVVGLCVRDALRFCFVSILTCTVTPGRNGHFGGLFGISGGGGGDCGCGGGVVGMVADDCLVVCNKSLFVVKKKRKTKKNMKHKKLK